MSKTFKFDPDKWMGNRALRACSAGARGFWVDLLTICFANGGYLHINGQPIDDNQLSRMVGESIKSIRGWLKELGEAGIFSVDDRGLYSSRMRRTLNPDKPAAVKQTRAVKVSAPVPAPQLEPIQKPVDPAPSPTSTPRPAVPPKARALPWYKSPAGWARKAQEQSVSLQPDEDFEDFKARVAARIPAGPHLDELTPYHRKDIEAKIEQYAAKPGETPRTQ